MTILKAIRTVIAASGMAVIACLALGMVQAGAALAQGTGFAVYRNCNAPFNGADCTIGVAGSGYATSGSAEARSGWNRMSQVYSDGAQAWRTACRWHYGNPTYASPDIVSRRVNCASFCNGKRSCQ